MKESGVWGLEGFTFATYIGLFGPAKMPPEVLAAQRRHEDGPRRPCGHPTLRRPHRGDLVEHVAGTGAKLAQEEQAVVPLVTARHQAE